MGKESNSTGVFANIGDMMPDEKAERDGIELAFGNNRFVIIRRSGMMNREYKSVMSRVFKPHQNISGSVSMGDDEATGLLKEVYAEAVVTGWRGFVDGDGNDIPFTKENCVALFNASNEIFEIVQRESSKFSNFARREVEESGN